MVAGFVFQPSDFARATPAEHGERKIPVAVSIQVRGSHVRDPRDARCQYERRKGLATIVDQQDHLSEQLVRGHQLAQQRDDDVQVAIAL